MFPFAPIRPLIANWRGWLPAAALPALMFAALLALGGDRWHFYREDGFHNHATAKTLGIAENLSPAHNFLLTRRVWLDEDGGFEFAPYGRFPVGGFALVKLAILPFGDDLTAKLIAARILAMLMFCGAALLACLAIARIAGSRWVGLAAALTAFSGLYAVYYADAVFSENVMELFGVALTFHGMAVFVQEGRFRQLVVKACAALLLGWHVYALLLPFIALGFGGEMIALARSALASKSGERAKTARAALISLVRSRYVALAAVAILFGAALLSFNLANEYAAYEGERTLSELPTFRSMLARFGLGDFEDPDLEWGNFLRRQFYRAGAASVPYAVVRGGGYDFPMFEPFEPPLAPAVLGAAALCAALALLAFARRWRVPLAAVTLMGFCWAIPMRHNTFAWYHPYEGLHYVWLALGLFALALIGARRLLGANRGGGVAIAAAALAAPIFATSVFLAGQLDRDEYESALNKAALTDFSAIMETARGKRVQVIGEPILWTERTWFWDFWMRYALSGSYLDAPSDCSRAVDADFVVSRYRDDSLDLLTPDNQIAFLYGATSALELCRADRRRLESSEPVERDAFDVYIQDGAISYLKAPCEPRDYEEPFFIHVYPVDLDDLHRLYAQDGFHPTLSPVRLAERGAAFDGACLMTLHLPDYPISAIRTGQWLPGVERLWDVFVAPPLNAEALEFYEKTYQAIASSGEPAARSGFDLYLDVDRDTLSYLKAPCDEDDVRGRFFLSVHPADVGDLPADRREFGHESLNFTFAPPFGAVFNGKCMATRRLPDYEIARIETGQWVPGGERVWDAEVVVGD